MKRGNVHPTLVFRWHFRSFNWVCYNETAVQFSFCVGLKMSVKAFRVQTWFYAKWGFSPVWVLRCKKMFLCADNSLLCALLDILTGWMNCYIPNNCMVFLQYDSNRKMAWIQKWFWAKTSGVRNFDFGNSLLHKEQL